MKINGQDVALISMNNLGLDIVMKMYSTPQMTKCTCCDGEGVHYVEMKAEDVISDEIIELLGLEDVIGVTVQPCMACMCKGMVRHVSYN